jgi:hypothetical protein
MFVHDLLFMTLVYFIHTVILLRAVGVCYFLHKVCFFRRPGAHVGSLWLLIKCPCQEDSHNPET